MRALTVVALTALFAAGCDDSGNLELDFRYSPADSGVERSLADMAVDLGGYDWPIPPADQGAEGPAPDLGRVDGSQAQAGLPASSNHPDALGSGVRKTIVIDGVNTNGEWGNDTLLIRDLAADDARFLGQNWTAHEAPWDYAALHAAWDDTYLYLGIQYVNVTDVLDPANLGSSEGSQLQGMDLIQTVFFDVVAGQGYESGGDMWNKAKAFSGDNAPDYQLYFHSNFSQEGTYLGAWNGSALAQVTDGALTADLTGAAGEFYVGSTLPGVDPHGDDSSPGDYGTSRVDYLGQGHATSYDTFFELKIPLALLGLGSGALDRLAIGLFAANGDLSAVDTIPDDQGTKDTLGTSQSNSPLEWEDSDTFSAPFVLVGTAN